MDASMSRIVMIPSAVFYLVPGILVQSIVRKEASFTDQVRCQHRLWYSLTRYPSDTTLQLS